jgi:hypothetical protein
VLSLLGAAVLTAVPAYATVMTEIPMEDLVLRADAIVHGSVLRVGARLESFDDRLEPHTVAELRVDEWLRGEPTDAQSGERIAIDELGGTVDGRGSWIDGTPRYEAGQEVIVFLRRLPNGAFRTVGMEQGRFEVEHVVEGSGAAVTTRTLVARDTRGLGFASWREGVMQVRDGAREPSVPFDTFVAFVRGVLAQPPAASTSSTSSTSAGGR